MHLASALSEETMSGIVNDEMALLVVMDYITTITSTRDLSLLKSWRRHRIGEFDFKTTGVL